MRVMDIIWSINAKKIGLRSSSPAFKSAMKDGLCMRGMMHDTCYISRGSTLFTTKLTCSKNSEMVFIARSREIKASSFN